MTIEMYKTKTRPEKLWWVGGGGWVGGGLQDLSVSPSPLWVNLGFKLDWTGLGLGLGGFGTRGTRVWD